MSWRELVRRNDPNPIDAGPACGIFYYVYSTGPVKGTVRTHVCPTWMAESVIERIRKRYKQIPVEAPVPYRQLILDPGGSVFQPDVQRTATFGVGRFAYPVNVCVSHADDLFYQIKEASNPRKKGCRRNYAGIEGVRFQGFHSIDVLPRTDVPDVLDWLRDMQAESISIVASTQEKVLAGTDNVIFGRRLTQGEA
jgi:hypothetical protein